MWNVVDRQSYRFILILSWFLFNHLTSYTVSFSWLHSESVCWCIFGYSYSRLGRLPHGGSLGIAASVFFSGWMPFMSPNQQCQSIEGSISWLVVIRSMFVMRPSYRPHYASCPSICPSVRLSICPVWARNSKTKKCTKVKIGIGAHHRTSMVSGVPVFS